METIPDEVLDQFVKGVNLRPGSLRDQLGHEPTLLVFLRFFGCTFCRETISDVRAAAEADPAYPSVLFIFQGTSRDGRAFLRHYWPEARAISDPELELYEAFGVHQGSLLQMLGPGVLVAKRRANAKGHRNGERDGDIWRLPGLFVVAGKRILWRHDFRHAADHPDFTSIPSAFESVHA